MMSLLSRLVFVFALIGVAASSAIAAEPVRALGFVIGTTKRAEVEEGVAAAGLEAYADGKNRYSQGTMLRVDGPQFEIDGLTSSVFIFDAYDHLVAVSLTLDKGRYRAVAALLKDKYPLQNEKTAFVGDQAVYFRTADGTRIEAIAPHMSFVMAVNYYTAGFAGAMDLVKRAERDAQVANEARRF